MKLSVLIPARNEEWLNRTVDDVLANSTAETDVIVVLDGAWPSTPLPQHPRVSVIFEPMPVGQRAATNLAARVSTAQYVMKADAHCSFAPGFDTALVEAAELLGRNVLQVPTQKNLNVWEWICRCGWRGPQSPKPPACPACNGAGVEREVVWKPRRGTTTTAWRFDDTLHFQYAREMERAQVGDYPETMSLLGACWFVDRCWFLDDLEGLDERHGSWGNMGTELACKAWLSGGRVVTNKRTHFAHFFRVNGIGFPYEIRASDQERARDYSRSVWMANAWPKQIRPLSWLVEKFRPVAGWSDVAVARLPKTLDPGCAIVAEPSSDPARLLQAATGRTGTPEAPGVATDARGTEPAGMSAHVPARRETGTHAASAGVLYYSDNSADACVLEAARTQLRRAAGDLPIVAVTLPGQERRGRFEGALHVVLQAERGAVTMARQILTGLQMLDTDAVFFCEHDVLYAPDYFDFRPPTADAYYYAANTWKVDAETGRALTYEMEQLSGLCADRRLLLDHFRRRVAHLEQHGFSRRMGFEPGKPVRHGGLDDVPRRTWRNATPIVDIRHSANLTPSRWRREQFRNQRYTAGWTESDTIPGWGQTAGRFTEWLAEVTDHGNPR